METERLRQFCVIVESRSMTQASEILGISLSGLSKSMRQLQDDLGFEVLQPEGRGLAITDAGQEVYRKSHSLLEQVARLAQTDQELVQSHRVGAVEVFTHSFLGKVLQDEFPESLLEISDLRGGEIERALLEKKIDIGVTYFPQPQEELEYTKIKSTSLQVFVKQTKPLPTIDPNLKFVMPLSIDSPEVTELFDRDGWPDLDAPRTQGLRTNRLSTAIDFVLRSDYAIFMPQFLADDINENQRPGQQLVSLPLEKRWRKIQRDIFVVKRKSSPESRLFKVIAKHLRRL